MWNFESKFISVYKTHFHTDSSLQPFQNYHHQSTMLQKLSTSEVKSSLYWNLIILLPLIFYVKLICRILNVKKLSFLAKLEVLNLDSSKFEQFFKSQIYQNSNFRVSKIVKRQFLIFKWSQTWLHVELDGNLISTLLILI